MPRQSGETGADGPAITGQRVQDGIERRYIHIESKRLKGAFARLESIARDGGTIVSPGGGGLAMRDWRIDVRAEGAEGSFFMGQSFPGEALSAPLERAAADGRGLTEEEARAFLSALAATAKAMDCMESASRALARFMPEAIIVSRDSILFLPCALADLAGARAPGAAHCGSAASFAGFVAEAALRLPAAALASSAGSPAGPGGARRAEAAARLSLAIASPRLKAELARLAEPPKEGKKNSSYPSMSRWAGAFAGGEGCLRDIDPEEGPRHAAKLEAALSRQMGKARLGGFIQKRSLVLGIAGIILAVIAIFTVPPAYKKKALEIRIQAMGPEELVRAYYAAIDGMDLEFIDGAARKEYASFDSQMAMNVSILSKYRFAVEQRENLMRAADWVKAGKPALDPSFILYGIVGLELSPLDEGSGKPAFTAEYSLWLMEGEEGRPLAPREWVTRDEVRLEPWGKGFRIRSISRTRGYPDGLKGGAASP